MQNRSTITTLLIIIAIIALGLFWYIREQKYLSITTYQECVDAGYPILDIYPQKCRTPDNRLLVNESQVPVPTPTPTATSSYQTTNEKVRVTSPTPNSIITSPLTVSGSARGTWYFEASFPVELVDGNGRQIAIKPAQTTSDWMTTDFVPFTMTLTYAKPTTATGTLILHKDNPSGDPARDESVRIPVRFN